jgi:hypothetical protein
MKMWHSLDIWEWQESRFDLDVNEEVIDLG